MRLRFHCQIPLTTTDGMRRDSLGRSLETETVCKVGKEGRDMTGRDGRQGSSLHSSRSTSRRGSEHARARVLVSLAAQHLRVARGGPRAWQSHGRSGGGRDGEGGRRDGVVRCKSAHMWSRQQQQQRWQRSAVAVSRSFTSFNTDNWDRPARARRRRETEGKRDGDKPWFCYPPCLAVFGASR